MQKLQLQVGCQGYEGYRKGVEAMKRQGLATMPAGLVGFGVADCLSLIWFAA
jgi:hypothetical protein